MQALQALADDLLALDQGAVGVAAGVRRLAGVLRHLADGRLQLTQCVTNQGRVAGLALGAAVQAATELGQGAAGAGNLFGMAANAGDQLYQVAAQVVERILDIAQLTGARVDGDGLGEVAMGPLRQRRDQVPEDP